MAVRPLGELATNESRPFDFSCFDKVIFINTGDVLEGEFLHREQVSKAGLPGQAKKRIEKGDILFSEIRPGNKRFALVDFDPEGYVVSTKFMVIKLVADDVDPDYFYKILTSPQTLSEFQRIAESRSGTFPQITFDAISYFPVDIPPLGRQKAIARILGTLDDKIELNRQINTTLESMAQALFKSWFVDFDPVIDNALAAGNDIPDALQAKAAKRKALGAKRKPLPDDLQQQFPDRFVFTEEMGWVPEGWEVVTMQDVATDIGMGPFGSNIKTDTFVDSGVPIINGQQLSALLLSEGGNKFISEAHAEKLARSLVYPGDLVFTHRGTIGQVSLIPDGASFERYIVSQSQMYLRPDLKRVSGNYLAFFFRSPAGQHELLSNATQVGVPAIARPSSHLKSIQFVLPQIESLRSFDELASRWVQKIVGTREQTLTLENLRDTLLPKLLSGELRIPEAEKQLAEAL